MLPHTEWTRCTHVESLGACSMFAPSSPALESSASRAIGAIVSPRPQDLAATAIDSYRFTSTYPAHDRVRG